MNLRIGDSATSANTPPETDLNAVRIGIKSKLKAHAHLWLTPFDENTPADAVETALKKTL